MDIIVKKTIQCKLSEKRIKYLGRYLGLRETKLQENWGSYITLKMDRIYRTYGVIQKCLQHGRLPRGDR